MLSAVNKNTVDTSLRIAVQSNITSINAKVGITGLCPMAVGDTENYTPDVFVMVYAQNRSEGILTIDDITYWSNGLWCIKDE